MLKGGEIINVDGMSQPLVPYIKVHTVKPLYQFVTSENFKRAIHFVNNTVGNGQIVKSIHYLPHKHESLRLIP